MTNHLKRQGATMSVAEKASIGPVTRTEAPKPAIREAVAESLPPAAMFAPKEVRQQQVYVQSRSVAAPVQPADEFNDIFGRLVADDDDIVGLLAYSIYKQNKVDWLISFKRDEGRSPDPTELKSYITGEKTGRRLATYRHLASATLGGQGPLNANVAPRHAAPPARQTPQPVSEMQVRDEAPRVQRPFVETLTAPPAARGLFGVDSLYVVYGAAILAVFIGLWLTFRGVAPIPSK